jgi:hypothetical protein
MMKNVMKNIMKPVGQMLSEDSQVSWTRFMGGIVILVWAFGFISETIASNWHPPEFGAGDFAVLGTIFGGKTVSKFAEILGLKLNLFPKSTEDERPKR